MISFNGINYTTNTFTRYTNTKWHTFKNCFMIGSLFFPRIRWLWPFLYRWLNAAISAACGYRPHTGLLLKWTNMQEVTERNWERAVNCVRVCVFNVFKMFLLFPALVYNVVKLASTAHSTCRMHADEVILVFFVWFVYWKMPTADKWDEHCNWLIYLNKV